MQRCSIVASADPRTASPMYALANRGKAPISTTPLLRTALGKNVAHRWIRNYRSHSSSGDERSENSQLVRENYRRIEFEAGRSCATAAVSSLIGERQPVGVGSMRVVARRNMATHYPHRANKGNRQGLHYSAFRAFSRTRPLNHNENLSPALENRSRIRQVGLAPCSTDFCAILMMRR